MLLVLAHQTVANGDDRISREAGLIDDYANNGVSRKEKTVVSAAGKKKGGVDASVCRAGVLDTTGIARAYDKGVVMIDSRLTTAS